MKKDIYYSLILVISLICNALFLLAALINNKFTSDNNLIGKFLDKEKRELVVESMQINPVELVQTIKGDTIFLNSIIDNGYKKLILVISGYECGSCIENTLSSIKMVESSMNVSNIIVLGFFQNKRELFLLSRKYPYQFFLLPENSSMKDALRNSPVFFVLDSNNRITSIFYPIQKIPELTINYLRDILKYF